MSGAAQNLSISQSSVTEAIKELENDLGVELFERHPRGLNITHKGHQFLRHATKILADVSDARRSLLRRRRRPPAACSSASPRWSPATCCPIFWPATAAPIPASRSSAIEDNGDYLEHLLIGGKLDVAVMVTSNLRDRMALQSEILEVSAYRLWLPLGHPLAGADIIGIGDIAGEPLIMLTVDEIEENTGKLLTALGATPHVAFRTRSVEAVRSLVATGAGVALLPDLVYRPWSLEGDRIESRDISGSLPVVQVGMVWRRGSRPAAGGARFHRHRAVAANGADSAPDTVPSSPDASGTRRGDRIGSRDISPSLPDGAGRHGVARRIRLPAAASDSLTSRGPSAVRSDRQCADTYRKNRYRLSDK